MTDLQEAVRAYVEEYSREDPPSRVNRPTSLRELAMELEFSVTSK